MARSAVQAVLVVSTLVLSGCAPWSEKRSRDYVTVDADDRHDIEIAEKHYRVARRHMDCHVRGQWCDLAQAEAKLREALAADVRYGPAHHSLGVLYFWQNKLYLAAWEFEYTTRLMPDRFEPLNNLGLVYESASKLDQAQIFYLLAREKAPENPEVIGNLARVSYRSGQSVSEMRTLLEDVLATNSRPEWRRWAGDLLGLDPAVPPDPSAPSAASPASGVLPPAPAIEPPPTEEELPLIPPPAPDSPPAAPTLEEAVDLPTGPFPPTDLNLDDFLKDTATL